MAASPADEPAPWEPVITRPDPMTAEEWEASLERDLAEDLDPDDLAWEDDFWCPDADLTEAELAEIAAAMDARAEVAPGAAAGAEGTDPAGVAQVLAAQAAAASARRRGPGQPGSARRLAGESSSAAAGFGTGMLLDVMPACPDLAIRAGRAAGDGDSYAGVSDDELAGVLCAWDRLEAHMAARKLAAISELARRRPVLEVPSSGRPAGIGPDDFCADEVAHALAESRRKAGDLMTVADSLDGKLPGTRAALRDGVITLVKAQIISRAVAVLTAREARAAEQRVLGRAGRLTPGGLSSAIRQAVMEVAPKKAKDHREHAARQARVERWGEDSGNGALADRELPPAGVLAADQRITAWARQLKAAGLEGDMDQLRARAFLDLLTGTDSRPRPGTGQHGHATWHACARPAPASRTNHRKRGSPRSPGATGNRDGPQAAVGFTRTSRDGPPGGFGTWTLTVHGREFLVEFHPSPLKTATTASRPRATTPAQNSGTSPRYGTPRVPARSADGPPASATTSTTRPTKQAAGPACATRTRSAGTTTDSNSTRSGRWTSCPTEHSDGPLRLAGATPPNPPGTRSEPVASVAWKSPGVLISSWATRGLAAAFLPARSQKPGAWVAPRSTSGGGRKRSGHHASACRSRTALIVDYLTLRYREECRSATGGCAACGDDGELEPSLKVRSPRV